jgi:RNA polymerase sigma-70 factor (ECF subfamily)
MGHDLSHSVLSDEEIIKKIINGESALFEQLISKYNCLLYKIARRYGFNHENAEDALQDTQITAYCKLGQFKFRSAFKTWLSKIMIHKCLYRLKYGYGKYEEGYCLKNETINGSQIYSQFENVEIIFLKKELRDVLQITLNKLPSFYKTVFMLREVEGYSVAETASLLHISHINVRVRLNRAKTILQKKLKHLYFP